MWFLIPAVIGAASWATIDKTIFNPTSQTTTSAAAPPSPYTLAVYGAMGLGLYWLYRKAAHA